MEKGVDAYQKYSVKDCCLWGSGPVKRGSRIYGGGERITLVRGYLMNMNRREWEVVIL